MTVILAILLVRAKTTIKQSGSNRRCAYLIMATMAYVVMDGVFIACDLSEECPVILFKIAVFVFYIAYIFLPFFWHLFVRNFIEADSDRIYKVIEIIPICILCGYVLLTPFTGLLWGIDAQGVYSRGPSYTFFAALNYIYYIDSFMGALICLIKNGGKKGSYGQAAVISAIPLLVAIINNFMIPIYQIYPFQPFCFVVVVFLAYIFMVDKEGDDIQKEYQVKLEQALERADEAARLAQEANNVKTSFLSNMSHDIRTPMNAIINLIRLAQETDDVEKIQEYLKKASVSSNFLLALINDVLDMSRIESGMLVLHPERLTRTEFLTSVETVVRPLMEEKHLHFHPELNPGEYTILVDKVRFNQIFFNLLSNAAKFTPEGGDVWFEVTNLESDNNDLKIKFVVRDNGIGMSEEFLEHIFEPFAREKTEYTHKVPGTGLGLPIVKSLVDAMNGTISVTSKPGEGTEFVVTFTVKIVERIDEQKPVLQIAEMEKLDGFKVLLVEDNEINTYVAQLILENMGCEVTTAENGRQAVEAFQKSKMFYYDVILMDVRMPEMDGIEATKVIRALRRADASKIVIIAMTADAFDDEKKNTLDAGMNYHLAKPINPEQLNALLSEVKKAKSDTV